MKEQKFIRQELLKNMLFNLILFTIIFTTFSILILIQFRRYLYTSVDNEIYQAEKQINTITKIITLPTDIYINEQTNEKNENLLICLIKEHMEKFTNPRVITILRDSNGNVINSSFNAESFISYLKKINFNSNNYDKLYEVSINSKYYYRGTTCKINTANDIYYVEVLVNINSEKEMMNNFTHTLIIGTSIIIILSIFISYYLSRKAIKPIVTAYKKQSEFVQNASHELRTPLTIIQAKQEMLLQSPDSKIIDKSEDIALTLNETRRLSKMITELMDLARSDSSDNIIKKTKTNLNDLVKNVVIPYQEMAEMQNKKMIVNTNCNRDINVDSNQIKQLLIILLDNALKYTEENDTIDIDVHNVDEKVFINVKDTGIGISDEGIKHVFERFYREDKARSRQKGGTGLGLSIAYTIVKNHNGSIKILHNKPKGTLVIVKI